VGDFDYAMLALSGLIEDEDLPERARNSEPRRTQMARSDPRFAYRPVTLLFATRAGLIWRVNRPELKRDVLVKCARR